MCPYGTASSFGKNLGCFSVKHLTMTFIKLAKLFVEWEATSLSRGVPEELNGFKK